MLPFFLSIALAIFTKPSLQALVGSTIETVSPQMRRFLLLVLRAASFLLSGFLLWEVIFLLKEMGHPPTPYLIPRSLGTWILAMTWFLLFFTVPLEYFLFKALSSDAAKLPRARYAALGPALRLTWFHSIALLFGSYLVITVTHLGTAPVFFFWVPWATTNIVISRQLLVYILSLALPYLLLVELPYRRGIARWKAEKLRVLEQDRSTIAQRLNDRLTHLPNQSDPLLPQEYDAWKYYTQQMDEVKATSARPFSIMGRSLAVTLSILAGLLMDRFKDLLALFFPNI